VQEGAVIVPTEGAEGVGGLAFITKLSDSGETHPAEFVTVKVKVPGGIFVTVYVVVEPEIGTRLLSLVSVQLPAGNPLRTTLPTSVEQVG